MGTLAHRHRTATSSAGRAGLRGVEGLAERPDRVENGAMLPRELDDLEVIEIPDEPMASGDAPSPVEPFRWLLGDPVPARHVPFAGQRTDPIGAAGIWVALGGLHGASGTAHAGSG